MSNVKLHILVIFVLVLLCPLGLEVAAGREAPPRGQDFVSMKPLIMDHNRQAFGGREVKGCMPKGLRHSSGPSRIVNFHTMGSLGCSTSIRGGKAASRKP
ncbi:Maintenance of mitochondrial morphology protein like [Actinidia chinensis var. chinensis]|uniref:Maintenance of mitochondrial morphology protein like n=1 Tax=Actinidia chinensis var. chinensis TaxID=1590841 RepID=A0A2R6P7J4_ACTCC|nr:Maintenance of mitochondrial morphology protein like [Actinidia chinensis var. chinensis]